MIECVAADCRGGLLKLTKVALMNVGEERLVPLDHLLVHLPPVELVLVQFMLNEISLRRAAVHIPQYLKLLFKQNRSVKFHTLQYFKHLCINVFPSFI